MRFAFEDLIAVMAHLRGADGCPWDREQTHASLAPYLLEESHEVLDAITRGDAAALRSELGDVLLQVVFHAQMAHEAGVFDADAVVDGLTRKLLDRHPHVFGDLRLGTAREVLAHWEEIKRREAPDRPIFDGIPASLPALSRAQKLLGRSRAGDVRGRDAADALKAVRAMIDRAVEGLTRAAGAPASPEAQKGSDAAQDALGDLLLAVVALADAADVDAEGALRRSCETFAAQQDAPR